VTSLLITLINPLHRLAVAACDRRRAYEY